MSVTYFNSDDLLQDGAEILPAGAAECEWHVFPHEESWPNKLICPASSLICRSHLLYHTNLLHEKAGPLASQAPVRGTRDREVLAR